MRRILALILACTVVLTLVGCRRAPSRVPAAQSGPATPTVEPARDLTSPEKAVRTYLAWTSLAYRMANSEAVSSTATERQQVFVDSYIQANREQGQGLSQILESFGVRRQQRAGATATVATTENWRFRYFSLSTIWYSGPEETASYDVTYTVVRQSSGAWLVDSVEATVTGGTLK